MIDKASTEELLNRDFEFFEEIILQIRDKYKNNPMFSSWYAAVGDNFDGETKENFISIGMKNSADKITLSRIRIPKNDIGKKIIEKFVRSYLYNGIKSKSVVNNKGEGLNTVGYILTNDDKYLEVYTMLDQLSIEGKYIKLNLINENSVELEYQSLFDDKSFEEMKSSLDSANHILDNLEEISNDKNKGTEVTNKINYLNDILNLKE